MRIREDGLPVTWEGEIKSLDSDNDTIVMLAPLRPGDVIDLHSGRHVVLLLEDTYHDLLLRCEV